MSGIEALPPELLGKASPLDDLGLTEVAWDDEHIDSVIDMLERLDFAILGGDVYARAHEGFRPAYDNWYCEREAEETFSDYATRSREVARIYVRDYRSLGYAGRFFALVVSNEPTAGS
jgi:hypothetical protein